jgi:hypothetical protein
VFALPPLKLDGGLEINKPAVIESTAATNPPPGEADVPVIKLTVIGHVFAKVVVTAP